MKEISKLEALRAELAEFDTQRKVRGENRVQQCVRSGNLGHASVALGLLADATLREAASLFSRHLGGWSLAALSALESWWAARAMGTRLGGDKAGHVITMLMNSLDYSRARAALEVIDEENWKGSSYSCFCVAMAGRALGAQGPALELSGVYRVAYDEVGSHSVTEKTIAALLEEQLSQTFLDDEDDSCFLEFDGPAAVFPMAPLLIRACLRHEGIDFPASGNVMLTGPVWEEAPDWRQVVRPKAVDDFVRLARQRGVSDADPCS